jgi:putative transposase
VRRPQALADPSIALSAAGVLTSAGVWDDARLLGWVLMPDHWHAVARLGQRRSLSSLVQRAKAASSREIAARFGIGPLWDPGYHDRALRSEREVRIALRYVAANPIRAGLVTRLRDYAFWGSRWEDAAIQDPFA